MVIKCCSEVSFEDVYHVFKEGFSDYIIQKEISIEQFKNHFFGPEGNRLIFSYIAYEDNRAVGLVLGGCKTYEGILTLRCGTMCVVPDYRGNGIARSLIKRHEKLANELGCKQLFLECITVNEKALNFYIANNYRVIYQLKYYTLNKHKSQKGKVLNGEFVEYKDYRQDVEGHVNWQNETWYLEVTKPLIRYVKVQNEVVAMMAFSDSKIVYLHVKKHYRLNGYASMLINSLEEKEIKISFPSQGGMEGFLTHFGFVEDNISQVEMYKFL